MMRQFKESSKIQLRFYRGRWYVIWPTKIQYVLRYPRFMHTPNREDALLGIWYGQRKYRQATL